MINTQLSTTDLGQARTWTTRSGVGRTNHEATRLHNCGHCVVFLDKTLYSHSASLHPGVQTGTSKCAGGNPAMD